MNDSRVRALLDQFANKRVLVLGDCMLDEYVWGRATRVSPEAPVLVVEQLRTTYAPGGTGNVAANIAALGGDATLIAVVGDDPLGGILRQALDEVGIDHSGLVISPGRPTTVKTRVLAQNQQVVRVDCEDRTPVSVEIETELVAQVRSRIDAVDAILFSDYCKGVLTDRVVTEVLMMARAAGKPTFANLKPESVSSFQRLNLVSLNQSEAERITGLGLADLTALNPAGSRIASHFETESAMITLGGRGLAVFEADQPGCHLPVLPVNVYDPCGCGDSAIAAATLARIAGGDWIEAATLANLAGNAKVRKLGVVPVSREDLRSVCTVGLVHAG